MKKLIMFVDALPYEQLEHMKNIQQGLEIAKIKPAYGYSVNLHYLMFEGKTPDNLGFFGEYRFQKEDTGKRLHPILTLPDHILEKLHLRFFHKAYRKFILRIGDMIPYKRRGFFEKKGRYFFRELIKKKTFLGESYQVYLEELDKDLPKDIQERVSYLEDTLKGVLDREENTFLSFYSIDFFGHLYGTQRRSYHQVLELFDDLLGNLIRYGKEKGYEKIVLVSDHGMSSCTGHVSLLPLEKAYSRFFGRDILYFYDSLYFQALGLTERGKVILKEMENYFQKLPGRKIGEEDRQKYGLSSRKFGDYIFVLEDGKAFSPNYFGYTRMKGYHGYAPGSTHQYGIVGALDAHLEDGYSSIGFYEWLLRYMKESHHEE